MRRVLFVNKVVSVHALRDLITRGGGSVNSTNRVRHCIRQEMHTRARSRRCSVYIHAVYIHAQTYYPVSKKLCQSMHEVIPLQGRKSLDQPRQAGAALCVSGNAYDKRIAKILMWPCDLPVSWPGASCLPDPRLCLHGLVPVKPFL
jgi:hypothetical protein